MKLLTYTLMPGLCLVFGLLTFQNGQAQPIVPNGGFETWDFYNTWTLEPQHWETPNNELIESVVQDEDAFAGNYAMKVTVLEELEGGLPQSAFVLWPTTELPETFQFMVKSNIPGSDPWDRVSVKLELINEDTLAFENEWSSLETINEWEQVVIEIADEELQVISEIRITVTAGYDNGVKGGSWETWISVDQMSFDTFNRIPETVCESVIFPNPSGIGQISLMECGTPYSGAVEIFSVDGKCISRKIIYDGRIDFQQPVGIYFIRWVDRGGMIQWERVVLE